MVLPNDISRCSNDSCTVRSQCLRFTDKGEGDVSCNKFSQDEESGECDSFILDDDIFDPSNVKIIDNGSDTSKAL